MKNEKIRELNGANLDIDLTSAEDVSWKQDKCPWNTADKTNEHKCAVKNVSICKYFHGIKPVDKVLRAFPKE